MDTNFVVDFVASGPLPRACRGAVLGRILSSGGKAMVLQTDEEVVNAWKRVLWLWRERVIQLRDLSWIGAAGGNKSQYLRNCQPSIVATKPSQGDDFSFCCKRSYVCPWCWCRDMVEPVYDTLLRVMPTVDMAWEKGRRDYPLKLVAFRKMIDKGPLITAREAFLLAEDAVEQSNAQVRDKIPGAITTGLVYPKKDRFLLQRAAICLIKAEEVTKSSFVVTTPSKRNLARLAAYICPYPKGALVGEAQRALEILEARKGRRLIKKTGVFGPPISAASATEGPYQ